jgi:hypothetical protein
MKNNRMAVVGVGACVAACAGSLAIPALLGAGALGAGGTAAWFSGASSELVLCLIAAVTLAGIAFSLGRRTAPTSTASCAADGACGCNPGKPDTLK